MQMMTQDPIKENLIDKLLDELKRHSTLLDMMKQDHLEERERHYDSTVNDILDILQEMDHGNNNTQVS